MMTVQIHPVASPYLHMKDMTFEQYILLTIVKDCIGIGPMVLAFT
jgi:hypothetical protein